MTKPQQKRAMLTREKILNTLETLLQTQEFETITIAHIAHHADIAVGTVYSHFKDKNALLPSLFDRRLAYIKDQAERLKSDAVVAGIALHSTRNPNLKHMIEMALRAALKQVIENGGMRRALITYQRMHPDKDIALVETISNQALDAFIAQLQPYREEIRHDNLREAARLVNYFVNILFLDRAAFLKPPFPEALRPDDETLICAYTDMIYGYLTQDTAPSRH